MRGGAYRTGDVDVIVGTALVVEAKQIPEEFMEELAAATTRSNVVSSLNASV